MKKANIMMSVVVFIMCIILVSVILMRVKAVEETDFETESILQETELRKEISTWKSKYEKLTETLDNTNQKIFEYEEQVNKSQDSTNLLESELKETNILLGNTNVKGEGIIITLSDSYNDKVYSSDISELINELKYAGAEAISVNGIRITSMTDITEATNNLTLINGQRIVSPYIVKAIGNQTYLYSTLSSKNGFIDFYTNQYGINIEMEKQKNIIIEKSNQDNNFKYLKKGED